MVRRNLLEALTDNITVDPDKCVFCGECVEVCVLDNLRMNLAPCRGACPLGVNCQGYVQAIARGDDAKAMDLLTRTLPFPGILARVCHAPCEEACHRKKETGEAVAIKALKRYLDESADEADRPLPDIADEKDGAVAIIGSGPAGLMAAHDLAAAGRTVTVFESEDDPGGMLRWAIPSFKLPDAVLKNEIGRLKKMGVSIECGVKIGERRSIDDCTADFDAVIVATGCSAHRTLGVAGEALDGVLHGLPFLADVRGGRAPEVSGDVVVIGGGNVAIDAAMSAIRLGAASVTVVSLEADDEMPALADALVAAANDGVRFEHQWGVLRIDEKDGRAAGVTLQRCISAFAEDGTFDPRYDACVTRNLPAEHVIVAVGQTHDASCLAGSCLADLNPGAIDPVTLQSADETVFVAGDLVTGPASVVEAMASGRRAAESVNRFLRGEHLRYGRTYAGPIETDFAIDTTRAADRPRVAVAPKSCAGKGDFSESTAALSEKDARAEASRCYSCGGPVGKYRTCWFCLPCEVECPEEALHVEIPFLLR